MRTRYHFKSGWSPQQLGRPEPLDVQAGRGSIDLVVHANSTLVRRTYRHGGLRRGIFPELFLGRGRPQREFRIHQVAFDAGVPTPEPVGWSETPTPLPGIVRCAYYSIYVRGAQPLPQCLRGESPAGLARQLARLMQRLHAASVQHGDLNLNNFIVAKSTLMVLDFDKARVSDMTADGFTVAAFARIARSARKLDLTSAAMQFRFLRALSYCCRALNLNPRSILDQVLDQQPNRRFESLRWRLFGGWRG